LLYLFVAAPAASLAALFGASGESWFALYLKRKALEERKKIDALNATRKQ
jgi:hypothetical protein